ncbi:MAG: hypothetical protein WCS52_04265 [bacterium]
MKTSLKLGIGGFWVSIVVSLASAGATAPDAGAALQPGINSAEAKADSVLTRMRELARERKWKTLVEQFQDEDIDAWSATVKDKSAMAIKMAEASNLRGQAFGFLKDNVRAGKDLRVAVELVSSNGSYWCHLGDFSRDVLKDESGALDAYIKAFECTGNTFGYLSISVTLNAASILVGQGKYQDALKVMERYDESDIRKMQEMGPWWGTKMLDMNKRIYAGLGRKEDSGLVLVAEGKTDYQMILPDTSPNPAIGESLKQVAYSCNQSKPGGAFTLVEYPNRQRYG